jgi:hypothetical protein
VTVIEARPAPRRVSGAQRTTRTPCARVNSGRVRGELVDDVDAVQHDLAAVAVAQLAVVDGQVVGGGVGACREDQGGEQGDEGAAHARELSLTPMVPA